MAVEEISDDAIVPPLKSWLLTLAALRRFVIRSLLALFCGVLVGALVARQVFELLVQPLFAILPESERRLIFTGVHEAFLTYFKAAFFAGVFLAAPAILYFLWEFLAPSFFRHERRYLAGFIISGWLLLLPRAPLGHAVLLPLGLRFFLGFASEQIQPFLSVKEYFGLAVHLLLAFGLVCEVPVVLIFLCLAGVVTPDGLAARRRHVLVGAFVLAALLSPPDVVSQILLALPIFGFYESSILVARRLLRRRAAAA